MAMSSTPQRTSPEDTPGRQQLGPRARQAAQIFFDNNDKNYTPDEIGRELSLKPLSIRPSITALKKTAAIRVAKDERGVELPSRATGQGGRAKPLIWNLLQSNETSWERINNIGIDEGETKTTVGDAVTAFDDLERKSDMNETNLRIWNDNEKTNPDHTKHVSQRGGFTAIDAYQQIRNATEYFGPAGKGWGWNIESVNEVADCVVLNVGFWYHQEDTTVCRFGVIGMAQVVGKEGRKDDDAGKKALTDAITKALSYLGFNSDVFLGKFDDSKYVAERQAEEKKAAEPQYTDAQKTDDEAVCNEFINKLDELTKAMAARQAIDKNIADFSTTFKEIAGRNAELNAAVRAAVKAAREAAVE